MSEHVFICYARKDEEFVLQLAQNLKSRGVPIWLDLWDISPGVDWDQSIDSAIYDCATFLIVLSPLAVESTEVRGELRTALDEKKSIVPVVYQECRIPRQLRTVQHIDFASSDPDDEAALGQLVQTLGGKPLTPLVSERPQSEVPVAPSAPGEGNNQQSIAEKDDKEEVQPLPPPEQPPQPSTVSPSSKARYFPSWVYGLVAVGGVAVIVLAMIFRGENLTEKPQATGKPQEVLTISEPPKGTPQDLDRKEMVQIPAGKFWMGCNSDVDKSCDDDEKPGREVRLDAFWIDKYEVTVADYRKCVEAGKCSEQNLTAHESCNWDKSDRADHPINCVDWDQARNYCEWAEKRLPSEAEWEKAARGEDRRTYPWGNEWAASKANTEEGGLGRTAPVGSYPSGVSPYEVYDMAGNVWGWTEDWYAADYYQKGPTQNPQGPTTGEYRSVRGGSFWVGQRFARVAARLWNTPGPVLDSLGFRCASS